MEKVDAVTWKWITDLLAEVRQWVRDIIGVSDDIAQIQTNTSDLAEAIIRLRGVHQHFSAFFDHDTAHLLINLDNSLSNFSEIWKRREKRTNEEIVNDYLGGAFDGPSPELHKRVMEAIRVFKEDKDEESLREVIIDYMILRNIESEEIDTGLKERVKLLLQQTDDTDEVDSEDHERTKEEEIVDRVTWFFCDLDRDGPDEACEYHIDKPRKSDDFKNEFITLALSYCTWENEEPCEQLAWKIAELETHSITLKWMEYLRESIQEKKENKWIKEEQFKIFSTLWSSEMALHAYEYWVESMELKLHKTTIGMFLAKEAQRALQNIFWKGKITFEIDNPDFPISIHEWTLWNLLMNMCRNAKKHWRAKNMTIKISRTGIIEIADDGKGIDESVIGEIFKEGFSGNDSTWLWLAQADKRIEVMWGKIEVVSHGGIGNGALFRIILPTI